MMALGNGVVLRPISPPPPPELGRAAIAHSASAMASNGRSPWQVTAQARLRVDQVHARHGTGSFQIPT